MNRILRAVMSVIAAAVMAGVMAAYQADVATWQPHPHHHARRLP